MGLAYNACVFRVDPLSHNPNEAYKSMSWGHIEKLSIPDPTVPCPPGKVGTIIIVTFVTSNRELHDYYESRVIRCSFVVFVCSSWPYDVSSKLYEYCRYGWYAYLTHIL